MTIISIISGIGLVNLGVLFIWVFLSSFGIPGGLVAMISSGALAANIYSIIIFIIIAALAAILGDILAYELARRFSIIIRTKIENYRFYLKGEAKTRALLSRYEFLSVFVTRFLFTGLCAITSYISGFEKLNRKKYISAVILGEILYAIIYVALGYVFKLAWNDLVAILDNITTITILTAIAIILIVIIWQRRRKKRKIALIR